MSLARRVLVLACFACCVEAAAHAGGEKPSSAGSDFFEKDVRPLLVERCHSCHGEAKAKGGLRLNSREAVLRGGDSGPAAVPGQPEESLLVRAVRYEDDPKMPPKGKLDDRSVATLTRWVQEGMPWPEARETKASGTSVAGRITDEQRKFWSFQPVKSTSVPEVKDISWPRSDIDRFLLASLEARGLRPAPPADRRTLIRRATFDLTGLPPALEEIDAFLADGSPDAFAKVVDRLLASPRYGERWGRHWLDLVRYADSRDARGVGGADDITEAYRYRDWVVDAFNRDLPYDRFVVDQIAGDLLPPASPAEINVEGMVATGLLAIGEWGTGDADKEKMMTDIVDDQIDVVGRTFLGLTLACARCHDHKFDPIPTADYYGLAGIFFSTHILPDPGAKTNGSPLLRTPIVPRRVVEAADRHRKQLAAADEEVKAAEATQYAAFARGQLSQTGRYLEAAWDYGRQGRSDRSTSDQFAAERGLHGYALRQWIGFLGLGDGRPMDRPIRNLLGKAGVFTWKGEPDCPSLTVNTNPRGVSLLTFTLAPRSVAVHPGPASGVAVAWKSPIRGVVRVEGRLADADAAGGDGVAWILQHKAGSSIPIASGDLTNGGTQRLEQGQGGERLARIAVQPGDLIRLVVEPKAQYTCDTTTVELTIRSEDGVAVWDLTQDLLADPLRANPHPDRLGNADVWNLVDMEDSGRSRSAGGPDDPLARWTRVAGSVGADRAEIEQVAREVQREIDSPGDRSPSGTFRDSLVSPKGPFWIRNLADERVLPAEARDALAAIRERRDALRRDPPPPIPVALVAQEGGVPKSAHEGTHDARIHIRGQYGRLGETVPRHFPRVLAGDDQPPIREGSGRLALARWIARAEHPLTARVMVNRIWQYHFGEGIVRTPSNFGKLGLPPTHSELLDHLAARFVASGWSIKAMHRAIMLSAAYQQSSSATSDALRLDPDNQLFGRMNRRRLESEAVRDGLLAVSGHLDPKPGGPAARALDNPRRTLYLMTIRSDRSSFGPLFDAADSTAIVDKRTISTVAPQALFLLNHPFVRDRAKDLARRIRSGQGDDRERIRRLYVLLYGRPPGDDEVAIGEEALRLDADASDEGDLARAWEAYCHVLLCANEFLYVD